MPSGVVRPPRRIEEAPATGAHFSLLSDLSANLFAALLLVLILLLQMKLGAEQASPPAAIDATTALGATPHRPLPGRGLVALLRARLPEAAGLGLDLTDAGVTVASDGRSLASGAGLGPAVTQILRADPEGEVRLYVFDNRFYADVTAALAREGRVWTEISVPAALRTAAGPPAWSAAFLALAASPSSEAVFRAGLARLLTGSARPLAPEGHAVGGGTAGGAVGGGGAAGAAQPPAAVFSVALQALAIGAGLVAVAAVEWFTPAPHGRRRFEQTAASDFDRQRR